MTLEQFDKMRFIAGMTCFYDGKEYPMRGVDFEERLIGLDMKIDGDEEDTISWKRCENCHFESI